MIEDHIRRTAFAKMSGLEVWPIVWSVVNSYYASPVINYVNTQTYLGILHFNEVVAPPISETIHQLDAHD